MNIDHLVNNIEKLKVSKFGQKSAFLEHPKVKQAIGKKIKEGIPVKEILSAIKESGFEVSQVTFRKWRKEALKV